MRNLGQVRQVEILHANLHANEANGSSWWWRVEIMQAKVLRMRYGHPRYTATFQLIGLVSLLICVLVTDHTRQCLRRLTQLS